MSVATMEEEIVGVSVTLNQANDFQNILMYSSEFPEAWVVTSRFDHYLLAWRGC